MLKQDRWTTFSQGAVHVTFRFPRGRIKAVALWEQSLCSFLVRPIFKEYRLLVDTDMRQEGQICGCWMFLIVDLPKVFEFSWESECFARTPPLVSTYWLLCVIRDLWYLCRSHDVADCIGETVFFLHKCFFWKLRCKTADWLKCSPSLRYSNISEGVAAVIVVKFVWSHTDLVSLHILYDLSTIRF